MHYKDHPHQMSKYLHHQKPGIAASVREVVFGLEDGMVSTMGAVTGIAVGSGQHFVVVLSGVVIISVEAISMAVGSYLSNKSQQETEKRMVEEEREEIQKYPAHEKEEMHELFVRDGWPDDLARHMTEETAGNEALMLKEMTYRELHVAPEHAQSPVKNAALMWGAYVAGGIIPLMPYLLSTDLARMIPISVSVTLAGLFLLGAFTTKFSLRSPWRAGLEMVLFAGVAALIGFVVGRTADAWIAGLR